MQNATTLGSISSAHSQDATQVAEASIAGHDRMLARPLPAAVGIVADLGLVLSLILVLIGWGTIGTLAGIALGIASISGVITTAVLQLAARRNRGPRLPAGQPAYATVIDESWTHEGRRAA